MIEITRLRAGYGKLVVLDDVSVKVEQGSIVALLGPNGAGKSTLLKSIMGLVRPSGGHISYLGNKLQSMDTSSVVRHGICLVPEGRGIFPEFTVAECLRIGRFGLRDKSLVSQNYERVFSTFPILKERLEQSAGTLSGGQQQMLGIAMSLMASPKLLLLDEPSLGLAPLVVKEIFRVVRQLNHDGMTIVIADQNTNALLRFAHKAYVFESGRVALEGECSQLLKDDRVRQSLLGGDGAPSRP